MNEREHTEPIPEDERELPEGFLTIPPPDVRINPRVEQRALPEEMLDVDALKVVRRLQRFGYTAYLVGGAVRDILLGRQPKDFDVVTSARPSDVKRTFRNCRLIGRRFRLAHLYFRGRKIIETATFRRSPTADDDITPRHSAENLFGGPADDAVRRDFTINALMYDVARQEIRDYVDGLADIERRIIRTIGSPDRRFPEDPVRIIRASKFAKLLDLAIEPATLRAMRDHAPAIAECAPARLVEELFKILRTGRAVPCLDQLAELGVLEALLPALATADIRQTAPGRSRWHLLEQTDERIQSGDAISDTTLLAALLHAGCAPALEGKGDVSERLEQTLTPLTEPLRFTRRHMARVRQIFLAQRQLGRGPANGRSRRLLDREYAGEAIDLMALLAETEAERALAAAWRRELTTRRRRQQAVAGDAASKAADPQRGDGGDRRRRPPRRRRRRKPAESP